MSAARAAASLRSVAVEACNSGEVFLIRDDISRRVRSWGCHTFLAGLVPGLIAVPVLGLIALPFVVVGAAIARRVRHGNSD
jgi:hypothetical protein